MVTPASVMLATGALREVKAVTKGRLDNVAMSSAVDTFADDCRTIMVDGGINE
jgi:hypothetical protein